MTLVGAVEAPAAPPKLVRKVAGSGLPLAPTSGMIWTLIILWVLAALTFFGSLLFIAREAVPASDEVTSDEASSLRAWDKAAGEPGLAGSHAAVG